MEPNIKITLIFSVLVLGFTADYLKKPKIPRSQFFINLAVGAAAWPLGTFLLYKSLQHFSPQAHWRIELLPPWANLVLDFLLLDFFIYLWHRANHTFPFLWRWHAIHHTDRYLNTLSAYRFHFMEVFLSSIGKFTYITCLDISLLHLFLFDFLFALQNLIQHSNIRYPRPLERIVQLFFITPKLHFIHHSRNEDLQNKNFSTVLVLYDRIFGTFHNANETKDLGIKDYNPSTLKKLLLSPLFQHRPPHPPQGKTLPTPKDKI